MTNREKTKQAFGALHASDNINLEIKRRKRNNHGVIKTLAAVAACVVLVISGINFGNFIGGPGANSEKADNSYIIKVYAAELKDGQSAPVSRNNRSGAWKLLGNESDKVYYNIKMPVAIEGKNIKSISYSINSGIFQVVCPVNESIAVDGERLSDDYEDFSWVSGDIYEGAGDNRKLVLDTDTELFKSYRVNYDYQTADHVDVYFSGAIPVEAAVYNSLFSEETSYEYQNEFYNSFLKDIVVTCTVNFEDGSSQQKDISFESRLVNDELEIYCINGFKSEEKGSNTDTETETGSETELVTQLGDTIVVKEEADTLSGNPINEHEVINSKEIKIDVSEEEFAQWDWEPTTEDIMANVNLALGLKVGDSFVLEFEYGDCRVVHTYTILEIHR